MFICFEGCDGVGKTTQSKNLFNFLKSKNKQPVLLSFPDRETITGKILNNYLTNKEKVLIPEFLIYFFQQTYGKKLIK